MMQFLRRRRRFPKEMVAEAAANPGGSVAEIDPRYDRDGWIPGSAVVGAWVVDAKGKLTGEYVENPNYGVRRPLGEVRHLLADVKANARGESFDLFIASELTLDGAPVPLNVGMAIVGDAVLAEGFMPGRPPENLADEPGSRYEFVRLS